MNKLCDYLLIKKKIKINVCCFGIHNDFTANCRIEEEYARLRDYHVGIQRLRSQSVDPSVGRNAAAPDRTSPFQPYPGSSAQRQHQLVQQQHQLAQHHQLALQQMDRSDPRMYHPAALPRPSQISGHDYVGEKTVFTYLLCFPLF